MALKAQRKRKSRRKTPVVSNKIKDKDIREVTHSDIIIPNHGGGSVVVDEMVISGVHTSSCSRSVRADIIIASDTLYGIEIKSEADNLDRLSHQAVAYNQTCERQALVVHESHLKGAQDLIDPWWDIYVATGEIGKVKLEHYQKGYPSEEYDVKSVLRMLWRNELVEACILWDMYKHHEMSRAWAPHILRRMNSISLLKQLVMDISNPKDAGDIVVQLLKERAATGEWNRNYTIL